MNKILEQANKIKNKTGTHYLGYYTVEVKSNRVVVRITQTYEIIATILLNHQTVDCDYSKNIILNVLHQV
ncbi:hypothetical protein MZD04_gp035 [Pseudomonas phage Psa21]|uniref:Uncharacterized protein n=1 Tax=Pseudomonas phage Psa21 TaxID=2530023 RepID=A0A481W520_9CAUD|nr:hypothetical protein MZD04_gp035 [Pseudomonas phage Psa21]QBJ02565.1 hypothetical protein PSA21_35 [Pseudomonas phage Psa21]